MREGDTQQENTQEEAKQEESDLYAGETPLLVKDIHIRHSTPLHSTHHQQQKFRRAH